MEQSKETPLKAVVSKYEKHIGTEFKPSPSFYNKIGLKRKRYAQILRGEKEPTSIEIQAFADFFSVPVMDFFQAPSLTHTA